MDNIGLFDLRTPAQLREKLRHDLDELEGHPTDAYRAFNFFVTAEHLLDWQLPGRAKKSARQATREQEVLLQITSHLANGAKHFVAEASHHKSVSKTGRHYGLFGRFFGQPFDRITLARGLIVNLDGAAATALGASISAVDLARLIMAYWDAQAL